MGPASSVVTLVIHHYAQCDQGAPRPTTHHNGLVRRDDGGGGGRVAHDRRLAEIVAHRPGAQLHLRLAMVSVRVVC